MPYRLVKEDLFKSVKPGLSAYPDEPKKVFFFFASLKPLI